MCLPGPLPPDRPSRMLTDSHSARRRLPGCGCAERQGYHHRAARDSLRVWLFRGSSCRVVMAVHTLYSHPRHGSSLSSSTKVSILSQEACSCSCLLDASAEIVASSTRLPSQVAYSLGRHNQQRPLPFQPEHLLQRTGLPVSCANAGRAANTFCC